MSRRRRRRLLIIIIDDPGPVKSSFDRFLLICYFRYDWPSLLSCLLALFSYKHVFSSPELFGLTRLEWTGESRRNFFHSKTRR